MKTSLFWICIFICTSAWCQKKEYPLHTIKNLSEAKSDTVRLKVYVFDVYHCPPCPPGAQCKPCMENHLTAVDKKFKDVQKVPLESRLFIYIDQPDPFKVGKRYTMTVRLRNRKASSYNVELISSQPD